jgi:A1 cistron-splicing factor AAR2
MQADQARNMATQGGAVLMLGVPPGAVVGVDHQAFATGAMFKGVKMLPPGAHFLSCAATSAATGGLAPPTGFFLTLAQRQVVVKVWDAEREMLRGVQRHATPCNAMQRHAAPCSAMQRHATPCNAM